MTPPKAAASSSTLLKAATSSSNPSTSSKKLKSDIPVNYVASRVTLSYTAQSEEAQESETAWLTFGDGKWRKVRRVLFDDSVSITQVGPTGSCTAKWNSQQYVLLEVKPDPKVEDPITVQFVCLAEPAVSFDSKDKTDPAGAESAKELELAQKCRSFDRVRLLVTYAGLRGTGGKQASSVPGLIRHLKILMTGQESHDVQDSRSAMIEGDQKALSQESDAQKAQLGMLKACRELRDLLERHNKKKEELSQRHAATIAEFDEKQKREREALLDRLRQEEEELDTIIEPDRAAAEANVRKEKDFLQAFNL